MAKVTFLHHTETETGIRAVSNTGSHADWLGIFVWTFDFQHCSLSLCVINKGLNIKGKFKDAFY